MGLKSFALGAAVAYGIQHITKKREDGSSILSDFVEDPATILGKPKKTDADEVFIVAVPVNQEQDQ